MAYTAVQKATASRYARRWRMTDVKLFYKSYIHKGGRRVQTLYVSMLDENEIEYHVEYERKVAKMKRPPDAREVASFRDKFILDARKVHGDKYEYDKVPDDAKNKLKKIPVTCPKHGDFLVTRSNHINCFTGCPECAKENFKRKENDSFLNEKHTTNE